ncbi:hypothetical protein PAMP_000885 [Pampus punctatissimus]
MERNIHSFLLIHLLFSVIPTPLCVTASSVIISKVVYVLTRMTWPSAQSYCRFYYSELVTIRNKEEATKLAQYGGWIGLYLNTSDGVWKWSRGDENATDIIWDYDEPDKGQDCVLKYVSYVKLESDDCLKTHSVLCANDVLILVEEMKTWEEAFQHCKELQAVGSKHKYNLASFSNAEYTLLDRKKIKQSATTNEVWVGMRFLAGEWLWVNGQAVRSSDLPDCPVQQLHCGALVPNDTQWKTIDCSEKRNFLCSI